MLKQILHAAILAYELHCGLLAYTGTAGDVVDSIPFEGEKVDYLLGALDTISGAYLPGAAYFAPLAAERGPQHQH